MAADVSVAQADWLSPKVSRSSLFCIYNVKNVICAVMAVQ